MVKIELDAFYEFWIGDKEYVSIKGFEIDQDGNKVEIDRMACKEDFVPHENLYYETIIRWIYNEL
ncbi:hypothetical protein [Heyndrickxia sporothermodurans]|nr:hypothetical protein [Heyndrickxia sporothermodurans]